MTTRGPKRSIVCPACGKTAIRTISDINRAEKSGLRIFCNRKCAGIGRRKEFPISPRNPNWKEMKRVYDAEYREKNKALIRLKKAAYYAKTGPLNREKEREVRKKRMPIHVEYCRQPKYKAWKKKYDLDYRAREFAEYADAYKLLLEVEREIRKRATWVEIAQQNGTLNKSTRRKDEYGRITGNTKRR